jgi:rhomboid protease GluP
MAADPGHDDDDIPTIDASMEHAGPRVDFEAGLSPRPLGAILIIAACVVAFGFQVARGGLMDLDTLIAQGALESARVQAGEWWRTLSAAFLHGGVDHLVGNMIMLFVLGMACEHAFGASQFLLLYVASALGGSLASLALTDKPSVGASGAIFGLAGALIALFARHKQRLHLRDARIGLVLALWAGYQLLLGFGLMNEFVDNGAHLGGLLAGALMGLVLTPTILAPDPEAAERSPRLRAAGAAALVLLAVAATSFLPRLFSPG